MAEKPSKPTPDYPMFAHPSGQWAKKVKGKTVYFGPWADPQAALERYQAWLAGGPNKPAIVTRNGKAGKPRPDFPLYRHKTGQWAKRVHGKVHYFGTDPNAAVEKWAKQKDDLLAGRVPEDGDGLAIGKACNLFLDSKQRKVDSGEMAQRTWNDYDVIVKRVLKVFGPGRQVAGLRPSDFETLRADFAKTHGPVALHSDITRARVVFRYVFRKAAIDPRAAWDDKFDRPSKAVLRKHRQGREKKMFPADEIRQILDKAGVQLRAMVYLGINCGMGNNDCARLPMKALDLEGGWLEFGRPKTGIHRRCPLWPETVKALRAALAARPTPKEGLEDRVFLTHHGASWEAIVKSGKGGTGGPLSGEFAKVLDALGIRRKGVNFYALRHTFQTIGQKSRDKDAVKAIMGHAESANDMSEVYNEEAPDDVRLRAVTDYVHAWLFPPKAKSAAGKVKRAKAGVAAAAKTGN